jgi:AcrR family transcriptional regulator
MVATPTTTKGRRTRGKVLEAARRVFGRDGYVDARMQDVAREAGLSTGGLYRYFENKTDVFTALIADLHERLYEASGHTTHSLEEDALAALSEANRGYIQLYAENRDVMRVFMEAAVVDERFRKILWRMRERHVRRFAKAFRSAYGVDQVAGVPVEIATETVVCLVEQCCYVWFARGGARPRINVDEAVTAVTNAWYAAVFKMV